MKIVDSLLDYTQQWKLPDVFLFTGNPIIKRNGAVVMGRGAAKQVRDTYGGIDRIFGGMIDQDSYVKYTQLSEGQILGWFRVKNHWAEDAKLQVIDQSTMLLRKHANKRPQVKFHMNFPGIGNGKLSVEDVMPILNKLPDNVRLYK